MRRIAIFVLIFFAITMIISCQKKENYEIEVITNVIEYEIYGEPSVWLKHKNKYYCFFEVGFGNVLTSNTNHFYVLNENGKIEHKVPVPNDLNKYYIDLFVRNDSVFAIEHMYKNTFYLDLSKNQWTEAPKTDDFIYEDEDFYVEALSFGEWGSTTWFKDKKTNIYYELSSTTPIINKLNGKYYLTENQNILEVKDPRELLEVKKGYNYETANIKLHIEEGSYSLKGSEFIVQDTSFYLVSKFDIATSFVANNNLYHIYEDSIGTRIGKVINKQLVPIDDRLKDLKPYRNHFNYRNRISKSGYQTVQFLTDDKNICGIIEIENNKLTINYFKNTFRISKMKDEEDLAWFTKIFKSYFTEFHTLTVNQIQDIEEKVNAIDYTPNVRVGKLFGEKNDLEIPQTYVKFIETNQELLTRYYYTRKNEKESFKVISFVWYTSKNNEDKLSFTLKKENDRTFDEKADYIKSFLTQELGQPYSEEISSRSTDLVWRKSGKRVWFDNRGSKLIVQIIEE